MALLAIIGLIAILWFFARGLKRVGDFLERIGDNMINYSTTKNTHYTWSSTEQVKNVSELKNKLEAVKETEEDRNFKSSVRNEIEELTGGTED
jgi:hypothetical protein